MKIVILTVAAIVLVAAVVGSFWLVSNLRANTATASVRVAWQFTNGQLELTPEVYDEYDIPSDLRTRDEIALYFFEKAERLSPERSSVYYNLGLWYLDTDCETAKMYFQRHAEFVPESEEMQAIVGAFDSGCDAIAEVLPR